MKKLLLIILLLLAASVLYYYLFARLPEEKEYRISFDYPTSYYREEKDPSEEHHAIILTQEDPSKIGPGREGPVSITIDIYENKENYSAEKWIRESLSSNFDLSPDQQISSTTTISGSEALAYRWDGLYQADNIVVATPQYIYSLAVTYISPEDQIRKDFYVILRAITIN